VKRVLQTSGRVLTAPSTAQRFELPRQGRRFRLLRVYLTFFNDGGEGNQWYFWLAHYNGEGVEIARISSTESEMPSQFATGMDEGAMHFVAEVEFRSHADGLATRGGSGLSQLMTAPLGCEGLNVETNDTVEVVFSPADIGLGNDFTVGNIYWHCDFDEKGD